MTDPNLIPSQAENALAAFTQPSVANALASVVSAIDSGSGMQFPVVAISSGNSGGAFEGAKFQSQEIQDSLPSGRKAVPGVFIGYRVEVAMWPAKFDPAAPADRESKPAHTAAVSGSDSDVLTLLASACKKYQYTKGADKGKFDVATSGAGHPRPTVQCLVYLPSNNELVVFQVPSHFTSFERTMKNMLKHVDPATGQLPQFPCSLKPSTTQETSKASGQTWSVHHLDIDQNLNAEGKAAWDAWALWKADAQQDPETVQKVRDWLAGADKPVTDAVKAALTVAKSI